MARIFTTGFELGSGIEFNGGCGFTFSAGYARTGVYGADSWWTQYAVHTFGANLTEVYIRIACKWTAFPASDSSFLLLRDENAVTQLQVRFNVGTQSFKLYRGATLLATGALTLTAGIWYVFETHVVFSNTVGIVVTKINGVTDMSFAGDTVETAVPSMRSFRLGNDANCNVNLDDIAVNDVSGSYQNSWIGTGGVYLLRPTSDGTTTDWAPSTGSDDYACVDEVPANTTDWVQAQASGTLDLYGLENLPADVKTVDLVETVWQAALSEAGWNELTGVIRHGGTNYADSAGQPVTSVKENYVLYKGEPLYVDPGDASAWTPTDVNALEAGVQVA